MGARKEAELRYPTRMFRGTSMNGSLRDAFRAGAVWAASEAAWGIATRDEPSFDGWTKAEIDVRQKAMEQAAKIVWKAIEDD